MKNNIFKKLLEYINEERESFETLISADNILGLSLNSDDIINYLEFVNEDNILKLPIVGNIIITEGDILSVLKVIHDIVNYQGEYVIYINEENVGINIYLIDRANKIYNELNLNVKLSVDFSRNYNDYLDSLVTILGSENFVLTASKDFKNVNKIIV